MEAGLKLTVTPAGWPLAVKATAESNPPETVEVMTAVPLEPSSRYPDEGDAERVNVPVVAAVTVSETVVVSVVVPEVPFTVMLYVPEAVEEATVIVMVEVPDPVTEDGLKPIVTPVGCPEADKATAESNPPLTDDADGRGS